MENNLEHQKKYFNKISASYQEQSEANLSSIAKFNKVTEVFIRGDVLDIGSGGIIGYETKNTRTITITDIAPETLKNPRRLLNGKLVPFKSKKLTSVVANVVSLPFSNKSFDTAVMVTTAHHLSVLSINKTRENIKKSFREINRVLRQDGFFIIHECFLPPLLKLAQEIFFVPLFCVFEKFGKPLPYFMSENQLKKILNSEGFRIAKITMIKSDRKVYIPIFPFFSPPGWLWDKLQPSKTYICKKTTPQRKP